MRGRSRGWENRQPDRLHVYMAPADQASRRAEHRGGLALWAMRQGRAHASRPRPHRKARELWQHVFSRSIRCRAPSLLVLF